MTNPGLSSRELFLCTTYHKANLIKKMENVIALPWRRPNPLSFRAGWNPWICSSVEPKTFPIPSLRSCGPSYNPSRLHSYIHHGKTPFRNRRSAGKAENHRVPTHASTRSWSRCLAQGESIKLSKIHLVL